MPNVKVINRGPYALALDAQLPGDAPVTLQLCIPMEPLMHEPEKRGLTWQRAIESRFGGTLVRQPLAMAYMDNF